MGGGGSSRYSGPIPPSIQDKWNRAIEVEEKRFEGDKSEYLDKLLAQYNSKDSDDISDRLGELAKILDDGAEIEKTMYGGSVAKHTDISGISDVDALVFLNTQNLKEKSPNKLLNSFLKELQTKIDMGNIKEIKKGNMAITVTYEDGIEIQLLPAIQIGTKVHIPSGAKNTWNDTNPKIFQKELTKANKTTNNGLVPAIKLMKSINAELPEQKKLGGYHLEAMAVQSVKNYTGEKSTRALLMSLIDHCSKSVLTKTRDSTGQSKFIDSDLGASSSIQRRNISNTWLGISKRLSTATSIDDWKSFFE